MGTVRRELRSPSGHVFRRDGANGPVWYAKYRMPTGRQVKRRIGPAWTGRGRPAAGYVTKRLAETWLRDVLDEARRGTLPGSVKTGATFADAAAEFLRYVEQDRACKPSTLCDYRSSISHHLLPAFGEMRLEDITEQHIERWRTTLGTQRRGALSNRSKNKLLVVLHGVMRRAMKVWGLPINPVAGVERYPQRGPDRQRGRPRRTQSDRPAQRHRAPTTPSAQRATSHASSAATTTPARDHTQ